MGAGEGGTTDALVVDVDAAAGVVPSSEDEGGAAAAAFAVVAPAGGAVDDEVRGVGCTVASAVPGATGKASVAG